MTDVAITLILAWSLGSMMSELGTAQFIVDVLKSMSFPQRWFLRLSSCLGHLCPSPQAAPGELSQL
ncbi:MAG: hypothetical protein ACLRMZ_01295 [Blautia marasmi]